MTHPKTPLADTTEPTTLAQRRQRERERRITSKMARCVFFTGTHREVCEAGVNYRLLVGGPDFGWGTRLPCLSEFEPKSGDRATCDKCRMTTREEAEQEVAESDASYARVSACLTAIHEKHGKARGLAESMPCPVGCGGTLRYSISGYNGHVHGQCSTEGCASWMQ
jgi:hypothetical protein